MTQSFVASEFYKFGTLFMTSNTLSQIDVDPAQQTNNLDHLAYSEPRPSWEGFIPKIRRESKKEIIQILFYSSPEIHGN